MGRVFEILAGVMGTLGAVPGLIFLPIAAVVFVLAMMLTPFLARKVQQEDFGGIWLQFSERYGYRYSTSFWMAAIYVDGETQGYSFRLGNLEVDIGRHTRNMSYSNWVEVELNDPRWREMKVAGHDPLEQLMGGILGTNRKTGNEKFDAAFRVAGEDEPEILAHLASRGVSDKLLELKDRYPEFKIVGGKVYLKIRERFDDIEEVKALLEKGLAVARLLDTPGPF